jgi:NADH:ubiquinone oxidoreductase subunit E
MPSDEEIEIVVCLGSSCFARGNSAHLATIKEYVESQGLNASIRLTGKLCQDECKLGPNLTIRGEAHHGVTAAKLHEILQKLGSSSRSGHATA